MTIITPDLLDRPNGLYAATLWMVTFDEGVFERAAISNDGSITVSHFTEGLRYLKSLHSVHSLLGPKIASVMDDFTSQRESGELFTLEEMRKLTRSLRKQNPGYQKSLRVALDDCIKRGLIPFLEALSARVAALKIDRSLDEFFVLAVQRLRAIEIVKGDLPKDPQGIDGQWWVDAYTAALQLVEDRFDELVSDEGLAHIDLDHPSHGKMAEFATAVEEARCLHQFGLQLAFLVIVLFSFVQAHRGSPLDGLAPDKIGDALEQIYEHWNDGMPIEQVVKWSNNLILRHIAAVEDVQGHSNAAT